MKKVKQLKGWGIFENNDKEREEYFFKYSVVHPNNMEVGYHDSPADSDMECESLEQAVSWIQNY